MADIKELIKEILPFLIEQEKESKERNARITKAYFRRERILYSDTTTR